MAAYVFNLHNGVVHQHANHQRQRQQGHGVEGIAKVFEPQKRRDHRQRQGGSSHQGGAPVAQKPPHHQHRQQAAFVKQRHGAFEVFLHRLGIVNHLRERQVGVGRLQFADGGAHTFGHVQLAGAPGPENFKAHHVRAILSGERARLGHGVCHRGDLVESNVPAVRQGQVELGQLGSRFYRGDGAYRLLGTTDVATPAGGFLLNQPQLPGDVRRSNPQRGHFCGIQLDPDLATDAAHALDSTDTRHVEQPFGDGVVDKPAQVLVVYAVARCSAGRRRSDKGQHHTPGRGGLGHRGVAQLAGQIGPHPGDRIPHIVDGF